MIKNEFGKRRVCVKEEHVCGGRCSGEGIFEAD
jgi:hypothetical protein